MLWIFGLFNCKHLEKHFAYDYARIFIVALGIPCPILILMNVILSESGFAEFLEQGMFILGSSWIAIEIIAQIVMLNRITELEDLVESNYHCFNPQNQVQLEFIRAKNTKLVDISKVIWCCLYSFTIIFVVSPLVIDQSLTIPMWMPFEDQEFPAYVYESVYLLILGVIYPHLHNTFLGPILVATAQFQILKDNLLHATDRSEAEDAFTQEIRIQNRLKNCIRHHNELLR